MGNQSSFVDLVTLYNNQVDRTIDELEKIYINKKKLQSTIHNLFVNHIETSVVNGKSVLIKPNWVHEEVLDQDYLCLRTNDNLLLCVIEETLLMKPMKVLVADAPVQGCNWDKMIKKDFLSEINELQLRYGIPVIIKDWRRTITDFDKNNVLTELHPMSEYTIFNLGYNSYLEPITTNENRFRITNYNPDIMAELHQKGSHKYCIAKDFFESDVVITVPKLKTHRMAGMTNALKLLVGINGDKEYLPHHRVGSVIEGGDNYKNKNLLRTLSNYILDESNRHRGVFWGYLLTRVSAALFRLSHPDSATMANAGWYGNDTIWRTVMDINKIALYGDEKGNIHKKQQRQLYSIMDGVIGGQGDGPLHPVPSPLGIIAISNNPFLLDTVAGLLYHINLKRVPLLNAASKMVSENNYTIIANSKIIKLVDVERFGIDIKMPPGWVDYNKCVKD